MDQYDRLFNFYRIAEEDMDVLLDRRSKVLNNDEHIIVMCNQQVKNFFPILKDFQAFVVFTRLQYRLLSKFEIFEQLKIIWEKAANRSEQTVISVGAATTGDRNLCAKFWKILQEGI